MHYTFFSISALDPTREAEQLNAFLAANSVLSVERQFVADGSSSFWSVCVSVATAKASEAKTRSKRGVDYRDVLSPEHFATYARLRTLRNKLAEDQGTPPYAIFTNEQVAAMAQLTTFSLNTLSEIDGIGLRLAGALWTGGSINQFPVLFHKLGWVCGQSPGPWCVSRLQAENLLAGRLISAICL